MISLRSLITGGRGYIGENLAKMLEDPIVYDIKDGNDILSLFDLHSIMKGVDCCFHLAAISGIQQCKDNPVQAIKTNIQGTLNVARIAEYYGKPLVFASSFAVYKPDNIYAMTKFLGEKIVSEFGGRIVRIANVYGGDNYLEKKDTAVARLMKGTWEDRDHGEQVRDFVHIDHVCNTLINTLRACPGTTVLAYTGIDTTINQLIRLSKNPSFPNNLKYRR